MPDTPPSRRLRLKLAAIAVIGGAMVLLPLGQVLRYQNADLEALVAERATLDPLSHALAVQQGLLSHRDTAERVLRGRLQLEPERQLRKTEVDDSLWALQGTLSAGYWLKALDESSALAQDWRALASLVALRQVQPADSRAGHQLLLEQAVQVMDLVSAALPAGAQKELLHLAGAGPLADEASTVKKLAALRSALQGRAREVDVRHAALAERQALLALTGSAAALLTLALAAAALWARPSSAGGGTPLSPAESDRVRRSRGRRSADTLAPQAAPATSRQVLQRVREASAKTVAEDSGSVPPA